MLTRPRVWVLFGAAAWTAYVWGTRLFLLWGGDETTAFKVVHTVLAVVSLAFAAAVAWIARDARRSLRVARAAAGSPPGPLEREPAA